MLIKKWPNGSIRQSSDFSPEIGIKFYGNYGLNYRKRDWGSQENRNRLIVAENKNINVNMMLK